MLDRTLAIFAYIILVGFVGILVYALKRTDVTVVSALALALAGWDVFSTKKR